MDGKAGYIVSILITLSILKLLSELLGCTVYGQLDYHTMWLSIARVLKVLHHCIEFALKQMKNKCIVVCSFLSASSSFHSSLKVRVGLFTIQGGTKSKI